MCGVVAIHSSTQPVASERLLAATRRLEHRGPDEQGHWLAPHRRVGLGHTRLRIIDLTTGTQPIANEDGQLRIVVNGEFYGFEQTRCELEARGHRFRTHSDSEIALHLYEEFGTGCLEHLRGEFAFVLWDEADDTLFAARDRFGIKPLFYARMGEVLYLASEVKALLAAGVPAAWDHDAVFQSLFLSMREDRSLYRGVRQVPAGHFLVATGGTVRLQSYWDAEYPPAGRGEQRMRGEECIEEVRRLLQEAIRIRMRADVPVGCLLSGGVDSSTVLAIGSTYAERPMAAFTIAFDHPEYDESAGAREAAEATGAEFWPIPVGEVEVAAHFADSVWHGETIQYNAHGTARFILSRAIQDRGHKVVLGGEGADELFAGYGFCRTAVLSRPRPGRLRGALRTLLKLARPLNPDEARIARTSPWLARRIRWLALPPLIATLAERLELLGSLLAQDFAAQFRDRDPFRTFFEHFPVRAKLRGREPAKQILYLWLKTIFVNYHLAADRIDMAHGMEVRLPFLDHLLFDYVRRIPVSLLAAGGEQKHILREAARPFLPERIRSRTKKPFLAPPPLLCTGSPLDQLIQDLLRSQTMGKLPFFDQRAIAELLDELPGWDAAARASLEPLFLMLASMCVLQERYAL